MRLSIAQFEMRPGSVPKTVPGSKKWTGPLFLAMFLVLLSPSVFSAGLLFRCAKSHSVIKIATDSQQGGYQVDQIEVTGGNDYPLTEVIQSLQLTSQWLLKQKSTQKPLVSLAEGTSDLLPHLIGQGLNAFGTDLWYFSPQLRDPGTPQSMRDFVSKWSQRLFASDAKDLSLASESVGSVLSHKLFNNLHIADSLQILVEVVRVLEPNGEARIADISPFAFQTIGPFLSQNYAGFLEVQYESNLLILKKIKSTQSLAIPKITYDRNLRYRGVPNGTRTFELPFAPGHAPSS